MAKAWVPLARLGPVEQAHNRHNVVLKFRYSVDHTVDRVGDYQLVEGCYRRVISCGKFGQLIGRCQLIYRNAHFSAGGKRPQQVSEAPVLIAPKAEAHPRNLKRCS